MPSEKVKKFLFPVEEEFIPEPVKTEPRMETTRELFRSSANDQPVMGNPLFNKPEPKVVPSPAKPVMANTIVFNPTAYEDAETIAQQIMVGNAVIVNLENLLKDEPSRLTARRIIDFICGVTFALEIDVKKVNASTFLITKENK